MPTNIQNPAVNTAAGLAYLATANAAGTSYNGASALANIYDVMKRARDEMAESMSSGYPSKPLDRNAIIFLSDVRDTPGVEPRDEPFDATALEYLNYIFGDFKNKMNAGEEMDPAWLALLDFHDEQYNAMATWLPKAMDNAIALGRPLDAEIIRAYDTELSASEKKTSTLDYVKQSLEKAVATGQPLKGTFNGLAVDHNPALSWLYNADRPAAEAVLSDLLRQNIAGNKPLDPAAWEQLNTWNPESARAIAKEALSKSIARNDPLDVALFTLVNKEEPGAAAALLEAKITDAIRRGGASKDTKILSDVFPPPATVPTPAPTPTPTTLFDAIDDLETLTPGGKTRMAVLYLNDQINRNGALRQEENSSLLEYLAKNNQSEYANILIKSLRASNAAGEFDSAHVASLALVNTAAAAALTKEFLQSYLARQNMVHVDRINVAANPNTTPPTEASSKVVGALVTLAIYDQRGAEEFAKMALADALNRGVVVPTTIAPTSPPFEEPPTTPTAKLTEAWRLLNTWNPAAAAEWKASFTKLDGGMPLDQVKEAMSQDQKSTMKSWLATLQQILAQPGNLDDAVKNQVDLELDLESSLMLVFLGRAQELEKQLRDQIAAVQAKNEQMGRMNDALGVLNKVQELVPASATAIEKLGDKIKGDLEANGGALVTEVNNALKAAGIAPFTPNFSGAVTKGQLAGAIQQLKAQIDALGNNQQTEMIRLQSLTTKRNEAFEIITNMMSKMAGIIEKILGNMR